MALLGLGSLPAAAQDAPMAPAKVLKIYIEEVKPGKATAHEQVETSWAQTLAQAKDPTHYFAMTSVSGPSQAWFVIPYGSFKDLDADAANLEKNPDLKRKVQALEAKDGELLSGGKCLILIARPDLSRKVPVDWARSHYYWIYTFRVRPGQEPSFEEAAKRWLALYDKAGLKNPWFIYQSMAGLPDPSFMVVMPMKSLGDIDGFMEDDKAFMAAAGEEGLKAFQKNAQDAYAFVESTILAVNPAMSYAAPSLVSGDPAFWKSAAPKPAAKKAEPKEPAK
jgi:hypothetical protein